MSQCQIREASSRSETATNDSGSVTSTDTSASIINVNNAVAAAATAAAAPITAFIAAAASAAVIAVISQLVGDRSPDVGKVEDGEEDDEDPLEEEIEEDDEYSSPSMFVDEIGRTLRIENCERNRERGEEKERKRITE